MPIVGGNNYISRRNRLYEFFNAIDVARRGKNFDKKARVKLERSDIEKKTVEPMNYNRRCRRFSDDTARRREMWVAATVIGVHVHGVEAKMLRVSSKKNE